MVHYFTLSLREVKGLIEKKPCSPRLICRVKFSDNKNDPYSLRLSGHLLPCGSDPQVRRSSASSVQPYEQW